MKEDILPVIQAFRALVLVGLIKYHMALEGQSIDITPIPDGTYYLVSKRLTLVIRLTLMVSSLKRA